MRTSEILEKAFKRIEKPENWMQGAYAQNSRGMLVLSYDPNAVCFCSMGALRSTTWPGKLDDGLNDAHEQLESVMGIGVSLFNDSHTHAEVVAAWQLAIAKAKENELLGM